MTTFEKLQLVKEMITLMMMKLARLQLFQKHYKMIAIDLSKEEALDGDSKAIQQINFSRNLSGNTNRNN